MLDALRGFLDSAKSYQTFESVQKWHKIFLKLQSQKFPKLVKFPNCEP